MADHVLVAGATGVVGYAAMKHFGEHRVRVTAMSRRRPDELFGADFVATDLRDEPATKAVAGRLTDVTKVVYAALYEKPGLIAGWLDQDQIDINGQMLRNLFEPLLQSATGLRHVCLLQGTKAYGAHVKPIDLPARENRSEAKDTPNFYWVQEEYLRKAQKGRSWSFSILRPQIIFGMSIGAVMNLIPAIGVYGALLKERGEPLHYPGGAATVLEAVDADLLARVIDFCGTSPAAANEIFNVTNGDVFVWKNVWPAIADALGMQPGEARPQSLGTTMPNEAQAWDAIRKKYGLKSPDIKAFVGESFNYADFCMAWGVDIPSTGAIVSTIKLRQAGFTEVMDTEVMFRKWFREFQDKRLLPPR